MAAVKEVDILAKERENPPFDEKCMVDFLTGSSEMTQFKRDLMQEVDELHDGSLDIMIDDDEYDLSMALPNEDHSKAEARVQTMAMLRLQYSKLMEDAGVSVKKRLARMELMSLYDPSWFTRNGIHFGLWLNAVQGQGTPEQVAEYLPKTLMMQVFGCFAMTELGHGSFVRGLETTATFDVDTQTFDLHTPSITATKWWIGGAAHTATHAAVFAQLVLPDGTRPGVHAFIVQLRSLEDHTAMPGIRIGDCGMKMGRQGIDNGYIQFNHVKLEKSALLAKYCELSTLGEYVAVGSKQMEYGALIAGRSIMVTDSAVWLKAAVTIATRFLTLRRSGDPMVNTPKDTEPQLIDFVSVQARIMPLIATAYALNFTSLYMQRVASPEGLKDTSEPEEPVRSLYGDDDAGEMDAEATLRDLHATCAGLKSFATWATYYGIDTCRQAMGGHGYSGYSGLSRMFADFAVQCTWEGDNTVMALQTARYLVASFAQLKAGGTLVGSVSYLNSLPRINQTKRMWKIDEKERKKGLSQIRSGRIQVLLDAFRFLLAQRVEHVSLKYEAAKTRIRREQRALVKRRKKEKQQLRKRKGKQAVADFEEYEMPSEEAIHSEAWNNLCHELVDTSKAHCYYVMSCTFVDAIRMASQSEDPEQRKLVGSLDTMCRLFILSSLSNWTDWFLATGYMTKLHFFMIKDSVANLCQELRSFAVVAVDAFDFSDSILRSPLGRRDGAVYDAYFKRVNQDPRNSQNKPEYFESQIQPLLKSNL
eukprot:m.307463 g.307463  ORF g.307463 m.307463 type:complete len:759 (-) comp16462_c1_seq3:1104-3380(-)